MSPKCDARNFKKTNIRAPSFRAPEDFFQSSTQPSDNHSTSNRPAGLRGWQAPVGFVSSLATVRQLRRIATRGDHETTFDFFVSAITACLFISYFFVSWRQPSPELFMPISGSHWTTLYSSRRRSELCARPTENSVHNVLSGQYKAIGRIVLGLELVVMVGVGISR